MNFSNFDSLTGENGLNHYLESQLRILADTSIDSQASIDAAGASLDALVRVVTENSGLLTQKNSKLPEVIEFLKSTKKIKVLTKELDSPEARQELKKVIHQATARFSGLEEPSFSLGLKKIDEKLYYRTFADWLNIHTEGDILTHVSTKEDLLGLSPYLTRVKFDRKISEDVLGQFLEKAKNLKDLSFVGITFNGTALARFNYHYNLKSLVIVNCPNFSYTLPRGMRKLEILHVENCPKLNRRIPLDMKKLQHFIYPLCPSLTFKDLLVLYASFTSKRSPLLLQYEGSDRAARIPSEAAIALFKQVTRLHPSRFDEILEYCDLTKEMSINYEVVMDFMTSRNNLYPVVKDINRLLHAIDDPIKRLYLSSVCERLTRNGKTDALITFQPYLNYLSSVSKFTVLQNFCERFLKDPNSTDLNPLHVNDALREMLNKTKNLDLIIDFLGYLRLAPTEEVQKEMLSNLQKLVDVKLFSLFRDLFEENRLTVQFLETPEGITGNKDVDESTIVLTAKFYEYQQLRRSNRIKEFDFASFKKELSKSTARYFVEIYAEYLLTDGNMKLIMFEVFPPDKHENKDFYDPMDRVYNGKLYLNILPEAALKKPDYILGLFESEFKRINVQFYGQEGVDEGGLGRQLLAQAMQGIMLGNSHYVKFERCGDGKWKPKAAKSEKMNQNEHHLYLNLGRLLGSALVWGYPIGQVFNDKFLRCILSFRENDFENPLNITEKFATLNHRELVEYISQNNEVEPISFPLIKMILTSSSPEAVLDSARALNASWEEPELTDLIQKEAVDEVRNFVRELWSSPFKSNFEIAYTVADGIDDILGWDQINNLTFEQFASQLQGIIDIETIKDKLHFEINPDDPHIKADMTKWFHEWLDEHNEEPEALENLIQTLTGARAVIAPITFRLFERNASGKKLKGLFIHSCTNQIDVPLHITREGLREALDFYGRGELLEFTQR